MSYQSPTGELSEHDRKLIAAYDGGATDDQLVTDPGKPNGEPYANSGAAGNARRVALRKAGRGGEVKSSGGGRKSLTVNPLVEMLTAQRDSYAATIEQIDEKISELGKSAKAKPAEMVADRVASLAKAIERAQSVADQFAADMADDAKREAFVKSEKVRRENSAELVEKLTEQRADAERELQTADNMIGQLPS